MGKHGIRNSIKSLFGSHIDEENGDELKVDRIEVEENVNKILTLINDEDNEENGGDSISGSKRERIAKLVQDFQTQYASLYGRYDSLTGDLRNKLRTKTRKEKDNSSSSSSSDSDSDGSSKGKSSKNGKVGSELQKVIDDIKQELESAQLEIADLNNKLKATTEEKEALSSEYSVALTKIREVNEEKSTLGKELEALKQQLRSAEEENASLSSKISELSNEVRQSQTAMKDLLADSEQSKEKLGIREREYSSLSELHEAHGTETSARIKELDLQVTALQAQIQGHLTESSELKDTLGVKEREYSTLYEKHETHGTETSVRIKELEAQVTKLSNEIQEARDAIDGHLAESKQLKETLGVKERDYVTLSEKHEAHGTETSARIKEFDSLVTVLRLELETLQGHKSDREAEVKQLREENEGLQAQIQGHLTESSQLKESLGVKEREYSTLCEKHETHGTETSVRIKELESLQSQKETEVSQLREETVALQAQISKLSNEIQEARDVIDGHLAESSQLKESLGVKERDYVALSEKHEAHGTESSARITEFEAQLVGLKLELESLQGHKRSIETRLESKETEARQLGEDKIALQAQIQGHLDESSQLKESLGAKDREYFTLSERHEAHGTETSARIKEFEAQIVGLKLELESLQGHKSNIETQLESKETEAKQLREENITLQAQIKGHLDESSQLKESLGVKEREYFTLSERHEAHGTETSAQIKEFEAQIAGLKLELESLQGQKSDLEKQIESKEDEIQRAHVTINGHLTESGQLKETLGVKERDFIALSERHEAHGTETSARIKELEAQVTGLELELESVRAEKRDMEVKIESQTAEASQLREDVAGLQAQISRLESMSKEREEELSALTKKLEENSNESESRISDLTAQVNSLVSDMDSLRARKLELEELIVSKGDEASIQVKDLVEQSSSLQQEVESLHKQRAELEAKIESKAQEISEQLVMIQQLKEEITSKTLEQQRVLDEKQGLLAENKNLELKIETVQNQNNDLEEQIKAKIIDNGQLREEIVGLNEKVSELEKLLEMLKSGENEASTQIIALTSQIGNLQKEFDSLQAQKYDMELKFEREKQELSENHQTTLRDREDSHYRLSEEHNQFKSWFHSSKTELEAAERKIEEMAEEFGKKINSKDQSIADYELITEELKRDLEVKGDELSTVLDNIHNIEVKHRLSNQKLRITEQLLTEREESFKKAEDKFLEEQKILGDRVTLLSQVLAGNKEAYEGMITEISKKVSDSMTELEVVIRKFQDDHTSFTSSIALASNEVRRAKSWVVESKKEMVLVAEELRGKTREESELRKRLESLESKATKEGKEKESLTKALTLLEKKVVDLEKMMEEKNQGIVGLGEEKREAIRQLCLWIDYHQSRYDYLKDVLSKKLTLRSQRAQPSR